MLRSEIARLQGKFISQGSSSGVVNGRLNEDTFFAFFAYCLLSGQVLTQLAEKKELKK